jgi:hypothetical protein
MGKITAPGIYDAERQLAKEIAAAQALRASLALMTDDADAIRDTIEGETSLHELIGTVMAAITEDEIQAAGLTAMLEKFVARKVATEERIARRRAAIEQAMTIGEIKTLALPDATLSLKNVPPGLEITDEAQIPSEFWKPVDPKLDKAAIKAALKDGRAIPGATLGNGSISLQVRRT